MATGVAGSEPSRPARPSFYARRQPTEPNPAPPTPTATLWNFDHDLCPHELSSVAVSTDRPGRGRFGEVRNVLRGGPAIAAKGH
jgi:hypothetical protein